MVQQKIFLRRYLYRRSKKLCKQGKAVESRWKKESFVSMRWNVSLISWSKIRVYTGTEVTRPAMSSYRQMLLW